MFFKLTGTYKKNQRSKPILPLKERELYGFIGINLLVGHHKLPSMAGNVIQVCQCFLYPVLCLDYAFGQILWNLHVSDNSTIPAENKDKLYKLRPLTTTLKKNFVKLYDPSRYLSADESMILFKGRSSIKQYNPERPIKKGYKL